ncbi:zonadhesin-like isoform X2 [Styela clava]
MNLLFLLIIPSYLCILDLTNGILIIDTWLVPDSIIQASSDPKALCYIAQEWARTTGRTVPKCSSKSSFFEEQSNQALKWCVYKDGSLILHTSELKSRFYVDCKKSRLCPEGTIFETTNRCETSCLDALYFKNIKNSYTCRNKCICPPRMYKNKDGKCVEESQCKWTDGCELPKVYGSTSKCPATCATPKPAQCEMMENKQCVCPSNMVQYSVRNKTCVRMTDCPNLDFIGTEGTCYIHKLWALLDSRYIPHCSSINKYHSEQTDGYMKWCVYDDGTSIEHTLDIIQKFPYNCEKTRACPKDTVYENTQRCEASCDDAPSSRLFKMTFHCKNKCICARGMYRNKDGNCVWEEDCKSIIRACERPKVFQSCPSMCQPTCDRPKITGCRRGCSDMNCVCPEGMVQRDESNRTCIRPSECPVKECEPPKVRIKCSTSCPETCDEKSRHCSNKCTSDYTCGCPENYIQMSMKDQTCVKKGECPRCIPPKVYQKCALPCQPTCLFPKRTICGRSCGNRKCVCPPGMIQVDRHNYTCIEASECPKADKRIRKKRRINLPT